MADQFTEERLEQLLLEALDFAVRGGFFRRMGHEFDHRSFRSEGGTIKTHTEGIGIQVDGAGPVFHVTVKKL